MMIIGNAMLIVVLPSALTFEPAAGAWFQDWLCTCALGGQIWILVRLFCS